MTRRTSLFVIAALLCSAPLHGAQQDDRVSALIGLARVKRDAGDLTAARDYFERANRLRKLQTSELTEYFWVVADADPVRALTVASDILRASPGSADVRDRAITAAIEVGDEHMVVTLASAGAKHEPGRAQWRRREAESYLRQGRAADAVSAYRAALGSSDVASIDRVDLAIALEASGQHGLALNEWEALPADSRRAHPEWERSRLRALARSVPASSAAPEIDAWVRDRPDDTPMRELLVDLWARAGRADRAIVALRPLLAGPDRRVWMRREVDLARSSGNLALAVDRLEAMLARGEATRADTWTLAELLLETQLFDRAGGVLADLFAVTQACDGRWFGLADRVPGSTGTELVVDALGRRDCRQAPEWMTRGIERAVAAGRHVDALAILERLPDTTAETVDMQRLHGQLRLWTGDAPGAIRLLLPIVEAVPGDIPSRDALVDAYRAVEQPYAAWRTATPLIDDASTPVERLVSLAELAIDADQPSAALGILERIADGPGQSSAYDALTGRALLAMGRPADAERILSTIEPGRLSPPAALALVDSILAVRGAEDALVAAQRVGDDTAPWRHLMSRRLVLGALTGGDDEAPLVRKALARIDAALPVFADAETSLAQERPFDAIAVLTALPEGVHEQRAADLRATALAGTGDIAAAADLLGALRADRPEFTPFILRDAELAWRRHPDDRTRAALLALPARFAGNQNARIAAARMLAFEKRHGDVVEMLGGTSNWHALPVEGRALLAASLHETGRSADALAVVADVSPSSGRAALLRAELTMVVDGPSEGARAFQTLADRPTAGAAVFLTWASATGDPAERVAILETAFARLPDRADIAMQLSAARAAAGDRTGSLTAAERAVDLDPQSTDAWFQFIDATAVVRPRADLLSALERFRMVSADRPAAVIAMAERTAGLVRSADDPLLAQVLSWLDAIPAASSLAHSRDLSRVRLLASAERWPEALAAADAMLGGHPDSPAALRLRADVLSWSGRHDTAIQAYDTYLAMMPDDVDARRQQARVAGWAGRYADARRFYASLRAQYPENALVDAETLAKTAFFEGRWREAVRRYERWLLLEPGNGEARFELAEAMRAAGDLDRVDATLAVLSPDGGHRLAEAARERELWRRQPAVAIVVDHRSANGYGGQRLIDVRQRGVAMRSVFGRDGRLTTTVEAAAVHAVSSDVDRSGYRLGVSSSRLVSRLFRTDAQASLWTFGGAARPVVQLTAAAGWTPVDRWTVSGGLDRELLLENLSTIDNRLVATGIFGRAAFASPRTSLDIRSGWQSLSDGNDRTRWSLSATHAISDRFSHIRAIAWAEVVDYRRASTAYFAPSGFYRVDGGVEYAHRLSQPRFRGDRLDELAFGYVVGTDTRGTIYQHPSVRFAWEVSPGLAIDARADTIRSRVYTERSFLISLRLIGAVPSR